MSTAQRTDLKARVAGEHMAELRNRLDQEDAMGWGRDSLLKQYGLMARAAVEAALARAAQGGAP
jgi:hypothetical protein